MARIDWERGGKVKIWIDKGIVWVSFGNIAYPFTAAQALEFSDWVCEYSQALIEETKDKPLLMDELQKKGPWLYE